MFNIGISGISPRDIQNMFCRAKVTRRYKRPPKMSRALQRLNQRMTKTIAITKTIETRSGVQVFADGLELGHNRIVSYSTNLLDKSSGTCCVRVEYVPWVWHMLRVYRIHSVYIEHVPRF